MPQIVTINESVIRGAQPNLLQQKGCLISLGATKLDVNESKYVGTLAEAMDLLDRSSNVQVESIANDSGLPIIRSQTDYTVNPPKPVDPPVIGVLAASQATFESQAVFKVNEDVPANTQTYTIYGPGNPLPDGALTDSLTFTKILLNGEDFPATVTYKGIEDNNLALNFTPNTINSEVIPAGTSYTITIEGTIQKDNSNAVVELTSMINSWFANSSTGCYILELGIRQANTISTIFTSWFAQNPLLYYGYVFPRGASSDAQLATFLSEQSGTNSKVYFFFCGDKDSYNSLIKNGTGQKSTFYGVEYTGEVVLSDTTGADTKNENLASAVCAQFCNARPTNQNRLAPMSYRYLVGITPWPEAKNSGYFARFKTDNVNLVGTSFEGGVDGNMLCWGNFMNGDTMSGWYGADWCSINLELQLSNTIIEGSQPGINPLIYDQQGISRLAASADQTLRSGVAAGVIVGGYELSMVPFEQYLNTNPSDYPAGIYNGLAATVTPIRGFISLTFNLAIDFSGQSVVSAAAANAANLGA